MQADQLEIVYHDSEYVAINKPPGLLVHRTKLANDAHHFALQLLRNQLNQHVYPCHRLDRKTSGILLFAKTEVANQRMQILFAKNEVKKTYFAVVRGFTSAEGVIDYPLKNDAGKEQNALTFFETMARTELPIPLGDHATSRYSLVKVRPQTGRMHQIRKHFAHIFHPIIGDRPHGCNKQNKHFKEKWNLASILLHAGSLEFRHPFTGAITKIEACLPPVFSEMLTTLKLRNNFQN